MYFNESSKEKGFFGSCGTGLKMSERSIRTLCDGPETPTLSFPHSVINLEFGEKIIKWRCLIITRACCHETIFTKTLGWVFLSDPYGGSDLE